MGGYQTCAVSERKQADKIEVKNEAGEGDEQGDYTSATRVKFDYSDPQVRRMEEVECVSLACILIAAKVGNFCKNLISSHTHCVSRCCVAGVLSPMCERREDHPGGRFGSASL